MLIYVFIDLFRFTFTFIIFSIYYKIQSYTLSTLIELIKALSLDYYNKLLKLIP